MTHVCNVSPPSSKQGFRGIGSGGIVEEMAKLKVEIGEPVKAAGGSAVKAVNAAKRAVKKERRAELDDEDEESDEVDDEDDDYDGCVTMKKAAKGRKAPAQRVAGGKKASENGLKGWCDFIIGFYPRRKACDAKRLGASTKRPLEPYTSDLRNGSHPYTVLKFMTFRGSSMPNLKTSHLTSLKITDTEWNNMIFMLGSLYM
ncbi:hypothetical protein BDQ17DRAFT_1330919 [Cyathus striatus]|nr:hypothetical protein BDQ17DRAFT_1330919 [Cyathus striatus]